MNKPDRPFWETKRLEEMTPAEWESLCDGCGLCCMHKLENPETGEVFRTHVACRFLDPQSSLCTAYASRTKLVKDCIQLTPGKVRKFNWLPETCGYRLVAAGKPLPTWHPLISGDPQSVHRAGISARNRTISEADIGDADLEDFIIDD
jgi:uncharacterized cysteine cluster protein YcgN (CxxCxxCC family)